MCYYFAQIIQGIHLLEQLISFKILNFFQNLKSPVQIFVIYMKILRKWLLLISMYASNDKIYNLTKLIRLHCWLLLTKMHFSDITNTTLGFTVD